MLRAYSSEWHQLQSPGRRSRASLIFESLRALSQSQPLLAEVCVAQLLEEMERRLTANLQQLSGEVGEVKGNLQQLSGEVGEVKGEVGELKGEVGEVKGRLDGMDKRFDGIDKRFDGMKDQMNFLCDYLAPSIHFKESLMPTVVQWTHSSPQQGLIQGVGSTWSLCMFRDSLHCATAAHCALLHPQHRYTPVNVPKELAPHVERVLLNESIFLCQPTPCVAQDVCLLQLKKSLPNVPQNLPEVEAFEDPARFNGSSVCGWSHSVPVEGRNLQWDEVSQCFVFFEIHGEPGNSGALMVTHHEGKTRVLGTYYGILAGTCSPRGIIVPIRGLKSHPLCHPDQDWLSQNGYSLEPQQGAWYNGPNSEKSGLVCVFLDGSNAFNGLAVCGSVKRKCAVEPLGENARATANLGQ
jgi:hypothetical protein